MNQNESKIKYFLYARKSSESEDKQVASIDAQVNELKKIANEYNLDVIEILEESQSAKKPGRPVFNLMLERINRGEANGILCWKINRLARNPKDGGDISWMLQEGTIKHIQTFGRSYYPDDNVLMMSVELGIANQFIKDLSVDTKRGLRAKAERGWYPSLASAGYISNPEKYKGNKEIIKDPKTFDLVKKMFELMLTGKYNPPQILKIANEEWGFKSKFGRKLSRSTLYRMFTDSFYYGEFEYPKDSGNWFKGSHESMITKEEYNIIQKILGKDGKPRPQTHTFPFTGLIRCGECGAMITAEDKIKIQKNGNVHLYTYYHCTKRINPCCSQKSILGKKLEEQIKEKLEEVEIPAELCAWVFKKIRSDNLAEAENRSKIISNHQRQYTLCVQKLDSLIDMRASGEINEDEFKNKRSEILEEKSRLQELINDTDSGIEDHLKKIEETFNLAALAKERFETGDLNTKRFILQFLGSNLTLIDQKLSISLSDSLLLAKQGHEAHNEIINRLEPHETRINKETLAALYDQSPVMLGDRDSNPD